MLFCRSATAARSNGEGTISDPETLQGSMSDAWLGPQNKSDGGFFEGLSRLVEDVRAEAAKRAAEFLLTSEISGKPGDWLTRYFIVCVVW
jgi:hypothetical protein